MGIRDELAGPAEALASKDVPVRGWKGRASVRIQALDTAETLAFEAALDEWRQANPNVKAPTLRVAALFLCFAIRDEDGAAVGMGALDGLLRRPPALLSALFHEATALTTSVEAIAGESGAVPSGASSSV